jgi:hypothetical protein
MTEESEVKRCEDQDDADVDHQSWPEVMSEERQIDANYHGDHGRYVKRGNCRGAHLNKT